MLKKNFPKRPGNDRHTVLSTLQHHSDTELSQASATSDFKYECVSLNKISKTAWNFCLEMSHVVKRS